MIDPTPMLDEVVEREIRPMSQLLTAIVAELLGPAAKEPEVVRRSTLSVIGQCVFYHHSRPVLQRLYPGRKVDVEELARHVTRFSLAALRQIAAERES
jgi:hypothetical protein